MAKFITEGQGTIVGLGETDGSPHDVDAWVCRVTQGVLNAGARVYVVRDGSIIHEGKIRELWRNRQRMATISEGNEGAVWIEDAKLQLDDVIKIAA
ncbi:hypothetical protein [Enterovirga aerilata]|uniref:Uncharacterized protein n=1 Tax=Enterovirga aerilata TaxID=2730920 RepID=A0A849I5W8_9HYPH|nr:hypothetical protein [Enterovirga sp. DB1703]NNM72721.1 hypothetical protein [Enterovirga sp. DB1703]